MFNFKKNTTVLLHVGFAHSGTTSLQQNFFSTRSDFLYCGIPYSELGGIFSAIKYSDDRSYHFKNIQSLVNKYIWKKRNNGQHVIISDETLVEQPEIYYTPHMVPTKTIALRLKQLFPQSKVLFTIRNQHQYIVSSYLNLKRNCAHIAKRPLEDFDSWFSGCHTQMTNLFLRNLDYSSAIKDYIDVFGQSNVTILPLEFLKKHGTDEYLKRICAQLNVPLEENDITKFSKIHNKRMTILEDTAITQWSQLHFADSYDQITEQIINNNQFLTKEQLQQPVEITLSEEQKALIQKRVSGGNLYIKNNLGIPLHEFGYV